MNRTTPTDPDESKREAIKVIIDVFKHLGTLAGAAAAAVVILHERVGLDMTATIIALLMIAVAFILAWIGLFAATPTSGTFDASRSALIMLTVLLYSSGTLIGGAAFMLILITLTG